MNWYKKAKRVPGGLADKKKDKDFDQKELSDGITVEMEHTSDKELSKDIAKKVEEELQYPGQVKVQVIREVRSIEYAK